MTAAAVEAAYKRDAWAEEWRRTARLIVRMRSSCAGVLIVVILCMAAVAAPYIARADPTAMGVGPVLAPPSTAYLFGTDEFGRDLFSRVVYGSRLTLKVGTIAVGIGLVSGLLLGLVAGYFGGRFDAVLMRIVDVMFSFPDILVALSIVAILGPSLDHAMLAVGMSSIPFYARLTRSVVIVESKRQYCEAARALGVNHVRIMLRHVLPNALAPLIVVATLGFSSAVLSAAGLSFLGLGAQPPSPEWGAMLAAGRDYMQQAPWIATFPGLAIAISVLGFNLLGDGLREALDPRQRHRT